jgi:hypothetical protein
MNRLIGSCLAAGLLALAACSQPAPEPAAVAGPAAEPAAQPAAESAPPPPEATSSAPRNDPAVINFEGFGPAKFGTDEEQVRMSWGRPLEAGTPAEGATCYQLAMDPKPEDGNGILFMFEEGRFVRYDVDVPLHVAPGDFTVGASASDVLLAFAGRVEEQPHKYVEGGRNLVVTPEDGGPSRLVFEINAAGFVTAWRIGVPPQVHYVEGCG